ncbi:MAG: DUF6916 family protein [Pseudonocardiaceae bacterium]
MLESFTLETFVPLVGETFRVRLPGGTLGLVLGEASGLPARAQDRQPFSLLFREPGGTVIPQRSYPISHPELGSFELFIVPLGPDPGGMRYEAVFG